MLSANVLSAVCVGYVAVLFFTAYLGNRKARSGKPGWLESPLVYTFAISVYCTSWTFYGAVGSAARNGLEFVTIYLGPTLVFVGWLHLLSKLVRIARANNITSIADMISSRCGKSSAIAVVVTLISVAAATPYIALQLKAVATSFQVIVAGVDPGVVTAAGGSAAPPTFEAAFWVAAGLAAFTLLFGARNTDANERHHGVVAAIALEAIVKLTALIAVGIFVVFGLADGPASIFERIPPDPLTPRDDFATRWITLILLSSVAIICLPRQFHVTVIENVDERQVATASSLFPLYLFLISIFILPIAIPGLSFLPAGSNPDLFVLTLPMSADQHGLALLAFLGGFSSATSMVIISSIALAIMISNHIVMPLMLKTSWAERAQSGDIRRMLLRSRRISIVAILMLGFMYFRLSGGSEGLASIGLIAFAGVAQAAPSMIGGVFWRMANGRGALAGLIAGFTIWAYTLFLPSFGPDVIFTANALADGPWGIGILRPYAIFGLTGLDPLTHALFWSFTANILLFVGISLLADQRPLERLQGALFVDEFRMPGSNSHRYIQRSVTVTDLFVLAQRIMGPNEAQRMFESFARQQGLDGDMPVATDAFIDHLERRLAGSIGAASARTMISQIAVGESISLAELTKVADEAAQAIEYSQQVEEKSLQLEATARELREANRLLKELDARKDDFLNQVSHELRTPITSIRSFPEILLESRDIDGPRSDRFLSIIHDASIRLTRLLDQILELSQMETGRVEWPLATVNIDDALNRAAAVSEGIAAEAGVRLRLNLNATGVVAEAEADRLVQVFVNLINNAIKYGATGGGAIEIESAFTDGHYRLTVADSGPGIPERDRERVFEKFVRGAQPETSGAGLGLPISREIIRQFSGDLVLLDGPKGVGAVFQVTLPASLRAAAAE